jgi:hypothetical protein
MVETALSLKGLSGGDVKGAIKTVKRLNILPTRQMAEI